MINSNYAIVVVAYNREKSLARVLESLSNAEYSNENVTLIISIDKSDNVLVEEFAREFEWRHGNKIVKTYQNRLGLKQHIMKCGNFLKEYDAIIMLEDDTYVAQDFYNYSKQAISFYEHSDDIAGISLYNHQWQIDSDRPFIADQNLSDIYFVQYAQSWGQIWLKKQWFEFINWYEKNKSDINFAEVNTPNNIINWPDTSWLKYHIKYCIENNKYFVYPHISLSTNFTDVGQHNKLKSTKYQVPLQNGVGKKYSFSKLNDNNNVIYDSFFERINLGRYLNMDDEELTVDLYGSKQEYSRYLLSVEIKDYKVIKTFSLELKPHEQNIIKDIKGSDIFLYDTSTENTNTIKNKPLLLFEYDNRQKNVSLMIKYIIHKIKERLL